MSPSNNIFEPVPNEISNELFESIVTGDSVKIERIISKGHSSPKSGWYDQDDNEWVIVLKGEAKIELEHQVPVHLVTGSYLNIPAHTRHKVTWTHPDIETIWLAVHYK
ncbi:MAG TPA: cupin domain-containing protein [Gammaproteobacteria bacterium]|nr:cupin domain-containing protein [Gammaproteobacteria bacterium]